MAWIRPDRSKPRRSRPSQGRFNCGDSGGACGWMPSPGGPGSVGVAGVRGRESHGAGGADMSPSSQCHRWLSSAAPPASRLRFSRSHHSPTPPTAPAPVPPEPGLPPGWPGIGPPPPAVPCRRSWGWRGGRPGRRCPAAPRSAATPAARRSRRAGVRWGPVSTVAKLKTAGALRQSSWTRPPTTGS